MTDQAPQPVRLFDIISRMMATEDLKILIRSGCMTPKTKLYFELYSKFCFYKSRKYKTTVAVAKTCMACNVSERTVYNAIKMYAGTA